jgi:pimeloyl-ACP methyl ester carboxylesterase
MASRPSSSSRTSQSRTSHGRSAQDANGLFRAGDYASGDADTTLYLIKGVGCNDNYVRGTWRPWEEEVLLYQVLLNIRHAFFVCPENQNEHKLAHYVRVSHALRHVVPLQSPQLRSTSLFQSVFDGIVSLLTQQRKVRVVGHSYGGLFSSQLMTALAHQFADAPQALDLLRITTLGSASLNKPYNKHLPIRHFVFGKDFVTFTASSSMKRNDPNMRADVIGMRAVETDVTLSRNPLVAIKQKAARAMHLHNYEPFVAYLLTSPLKDQFFARDSTNPTVPRFWRVQLEGRTTSGYVITGIERNNSWQETGYVSRLPMPINVWPLTVLHHRQQVKAAVKAATAAKVVGHRLAASASASANSGTHSQSAPLPTGGTVRYRRRSK